MKTKSEIRSEIIPLRNSMNMSEYQIRSQKISKKVIQYIIDQKIEIIHTYIAINNEVDTKPIIQYCLDNKLHVIAPKIESNRQLSHWDLTDLSNLEKGLFSTLHPQLTSPATKHAQLILVPGVAFDKAYKRVGYGAGYYDRFLSDYQLSYKLGLAFDFQVIVTIDSDDHDIRMDAIVTENSWI